ncbi:MAG: C2 family cysteine protease [Tepidisphaeraceae bacterium]
MSVSAPSVLTAKATAPDILRSTNGANYNEITTLSASNVSNYKDTTTKSGRVYQYEIQAFKGQKTSPASNVAKAITPLVPVSNLSATATGPTSVQLNWTDNDRLATGYNVLRSTDGINFTRIVKLTGTAAASYLDTTVLSGQAYEYEVKAINATTTAAASTPASATTPLVAPSHLAATLSGTSINLAWTDNDSSATGYDVLRSTDDIQFSSIATLNSATADSYLDTTSTSGTDYYYEVSAFDAATASPASNVAAITTPLAAVSSLTASETGPTTVQLNWSDNDASASGYNILRSSDGVNFTQIAQVNAAAAVSYLDSTAPSGQSLAYEVEAFDSDTTAAASAPADTVTPLQTPTAVTATWSQTAIDLTWTDNDPAATGYYIFRSSDDVHYGLLTTLSGGTIDSYDDETTGTGTTYSYEVQAFDAAAKSAVSYAASATTPLSAVTNLTATANGPTNVQLHWQDNDADATGYYILHSTDGVHFAQIAQLTVASATSYDDTAAVSGQSNYYEVQAFDASTTAPVSTPASALTPLAAPTGLAATLSGYSINLTWTDNSSSATGYYVLRSTDNVHFSTYATLTNSAADSYSDTATASATTYYYEVQAFNAVTTSAISSVVSKTTPASQVSIATRYGDELTVTAAGSDDSVSVSQNGSTLTIFADGNTFTDPATAGGLFVYTRGGDDSINIASSVSADVTLETIDGAVTTISSAGTDVTAWIDATDIYTGTGTVHRVSAFAGGVSKAAGAALANPTDSGTTVTANASLFGTGPVAADVNQGESGDCYFLSSLAAFAGQDPQALEKSAVDMGDGTYAVQFMSNNSPVYVRVSNQFASGPFGGYMFAHPGSNGTIWAMVMEKAFCYFRTGANTYASIDSGWMGEVYADLGFESNNFFTGDYTSSSLYSLLSADISAGDAVTLGTPQYAPNLVGDHAYTLVSVSLNASGVAQYVVRNPWGVSGDSLENNQGYATLTYSEMVANFTDGCAS